MSVTTDDDVVPIGDGLPEPAPPPPAAGTVRAWAKSVGLPITSTGRLPDQVTAAYVAFHAYEGRRNPG